ncbi:MAG: 50S ribosome-binding GTPase [Candidatus Thermoplasmatota archaeon]|nr:50S ribosome-binding GTPase [Candidatus Thermoplasmatota archaeon]
MPTIEDKIKDIQAELKKTQYNKATEHHIGILKAKMSQLIIESESHRKGGGKGFSIQKSGDATVALVGYPNVGKSSLLNRLTDSDSEIGSYAFTTLKVIPGTMKFRGAIIQVLDLPGIIENAAAGSGRGREVLSAVRAADLILLVTDVRTGGIDNIIMELRNAGIVVGRKKKNISMKKTNSGGIRVYSPKSTPVKETEIRDILKEFKITNCELYIREAVDADDIIDFLRGNTIHLPVLIAVNKSDLAYDRETIEDSLPARIKHVFVSASTRTGIEDLKVGIYDSLNLIRIYMREKSGETDYERPLILRRGAKVRDVCRHISREMLSSFRYAIVLNSRRKTAEMRVGLDYKMEDEDVVTIISR